MDQDQLQKALNRPTVQVLAWGFRVSATLLLAGIVLSAFQGEELHSSLEGVPALVDEVADGRGAGLVGLGILAMILTPIASTLIIFISCIRIGDHRYARITAAVLVILMISATISAV